MNRIKHSIIIFVATLNLAYAQKSHFITFSAYPANANLSIEITTELSSASPPISNISQIDGVSFDFSAGASPGHAFVSFGVEDYSEKQSISDGAWGLYPVKKTQAILSVVIGEVPGEIRDDCLSYGEYNFIVKVSEKEYNEALAKKDEFSKKAEYEIGENDCLTLIQEVLEIIKSVPLTIPERSGLNNFPAQYFDELKKLNTPEKEKLTRKQRRTNKKLFKLHRKLFYLENRHNLEHQKVEINNRTGVANNQNINQLEELRRFQLEESRKQNEQLQERQFREFQQNIMRVHQKQAEKFAQEQNDEIMRKHFEQIQRQNRLELERQMREFQIREQNIIREQNRRIVERMIPLNGTNSGLAGSTLNQGNMNGSDTQFYNNNMQNPELNTQERNPINRNNNFELDKPTRTDLPSPEPPKPPEPPLTKNKLPNQGTTPFSGSSGNQLHKQNQKQMRDLQKQNNDLQKMHDRMKSFHHPNNSVFNRSPACPKCHGG